MVVRLSRIMHWSWLIILDLILIITYYFVSFNSKALGVVPGIFLGSILGGYLLKRFNMGPVGASKLALAASIGSLLATVCMMVTGCPNPNIAGVTASYGLYR